MARPSFKLTVRAGADVDHAKFDDLDEAVEAMREWAFKVRAEGPPKTAKLVKTFEPKDQVQARLQLSTGGFLRKTVAGIDVRGDGTFVPFAGGVAPRGARPEHPRHPFRPGARDFGRSPPMTDHMNSPGVPKGSFAAGERVKIPPAPSPPTPSSSTGSNRKRARTSTSRAASSTSPGRS